jgi:hypothetical protein
VTALAASRLVRSRNLRDQAGEQYCVVVDFSPNESDLYAVKSIYVFEDGSEIVMDVEHAHELETACFVLGSRVLRAVKRMAERRAA